MTDASGVADVSSLETGGLLRMSITSERASGEFLIEFTKEATAGQQTIKLFHWRCRGNVMQGAVFNPDLRLSASSTRLSALKDLPMGSAPSSAGVSRLGRGDVIRNLSPTRL